jgi:hypothetical protein
MKIRKEVRATLTGDMATSWGYDCDATGGLILHREDGPAYILSNDGIITEAYWFINYQFHREDGPARISYYATDYGRIRDMLWFLCDEPYYNYSHYKKTLALAKSIVTLQDAIMNIKHHSEYIRRKCQEIIDES